MTQKTSPSNTENREIVSTRILNAPRQLVYQAWTEPGHLINWWGPRGFSNTFHEITIKPGGVWRFLMHGPNGVDYPNKIVFKEVVMNERLVFDHGGEDHSQGSFHVIVTFEDEGQKTRLTMCSLFATAEERNTTVKDHGAIEGARQTLDRLEEELASMLFGDPFVIERRLNAPRELVWRLWTEKEHLIQWWGPEGMKVTIEKLELIPGGTFLYSMESPDSPKTWGKFTFRDIIEPSSMVFVVCFCDEKGMPKHHPMAEDWPLEILNKVVLTEEDGKTIVKISGVPINATPEEAQVFRDNFEGMVGGWNGTFGQLEGYVERLG